MFPQCFRWVSHAKRDSPNRKGTNSKNNFRDHRQQQTQTAYLTSDHCGISFWYHQFCWSTDANWYYIDVSRITIYIILYYYYNNYYCSYYCYCYYYYFYQWLLLWLLLCFLKTNILLYLLLLFSVSVVFSMFFYLLSFPTPKHHRQGRGSRPPDISRPNVVSTLQRQCLRNMERFHRRN